MSKNTKSVAPIVAASVPVVASVPATPAPAKTIQEQIAELMAQADALKVMAEEQTKQNRAALEKTFVDFVLSFSEGRMIGTNTTPTKMTKEEIASCFHTFAKHGTIFPAEKSLAGNGINKDGSARKAPVRQSWATILEICEGRIAETPVQWSVYMQKFNMANAAVVYSKLASEGIIYSETIGKGKIPAKLRKLVEDEAKELAEAAKEVATPATNAA